jgi:hypothetical protein
MCLGKNLKLCSCELKLHEALKYGISERELKRWWLKIKLNQPLNLKKKTITNLNKIA